MKISYKYSIIFIIVIISSMFIFDQTIRYDKWQKIWEEDRIEPTPLTIEQMLNDKQEPREKHEPTYEKGQFPPPCGPRCPDDIEKPLVYPRGGFGYPRDTTGNYDHCFSYETDPEYGVEIQNSTHRLNPENCDWEYIGPATNSINKWPGAPIYKEQQEDEN